MYCQYTKYRATGEWAVKATGADVVYLNSGDWVTIRRRDGQKRRAQVERRLWSAADVAIWSIRHAQERADEPAARVAYPRYPANDDAVEERREAVIVPVVPPMRIARPEPPPMEDLIRVGAEEQGAAPEAPMPEADSAADELGALLAKPARIEDHEAPKAPAVETEVPIF